MENLLQYSLVFNGPYFFSCFFIVKIKIWEYESLNRYLNPEHTLTLKLAEFTVLTSPCIIPVIFHNSQMKEGLLNGLWNIVAISHEPVVRLQHYSGLFKKKRFGCWASKESGAEQEWIAGACEGEWLRLSLGYESMNLMRCCSCWLPQLYEALVGWRFVCDQTYHLMGQKMGVFVLFLYYIGSVLGFVILVCLWSILFSL